MTPNLSVDAVGDLTCTCLLAECEWTSWAVDEGERAMKEGLHALREHPGKA